MYAFLLIIHVLAAILLVAVILIQRGRGGGLVESFSGMESMFGTKTSQFLTRATAVLGGLFLLTSITLAVLSARQSRSLIREEAVATEQPAEQKEMPAEQKKAEESSQPAETGAPSFPEATTQESLPE